MPERTPDNNGVWMYQTPIPNQDAKLNPIGVQSPNLVEGA